VPDNGFWIVTAHPWRPGARLLWWVYDGQRHPVTSKEHLIEAALALMNGA
jgi:hypothetical protein